MTFFQIGLSDFKVLFLVLGFSIWDSQGEDFSYQVRLAIFSDQQFFWPGLALLQKTPTPPENPSKPPNAEKAADTDIFSDKLILIVFLLMMRF